MKRLIQASYPEFREEFPVKINYHSKNKLDDIEIKMSYKTAFLFIDGQNVCTFYPEKSHTPGMWAAEIQEWCEDYGHPIDYAVAEELARYMIANVR